MDKDFFECIPEALAVIGENASILFSNQRFCSYFGNIQKLTDIVFLDRQTEEPLPSMNFNYYFDNPRNDIEVSYRKWKNSSPQYFSISHKSFTENDEKKICFSFRDITAPVYNATVFETFYDEINRLTVEKDEATQKLKKQNMEIQQQLFLAQDIQKKLFPPIRTSFGNYEIASKITPASQVSGDLVFFFERDQAHIDIITADIAGHGIPSALITILLRTSLQNAINAKHKPAQILKDVNNDLCDISSNAGVFATILYCQIDIVSDEIIIFNCAHPAPFHVHFKKLLLEQNNDGDNGKMIGVAEELEFKQQLFHLDIGDFLFIITDGVTEARNANGDFFEETFKESLINISKNHADFSPIQAIRFLLDKLNKHIEVPESYSDDVTIICIKKIKGREF